MIEYAIMLLFPAAMAFAAASDFITMTIPNRISIVLVAGFALLAAILGMPLATVGEHLMTGFAVLAVCFGLFAFKFIGGGDAKLLAVGALWMGWPETMTFFIYTSLFGGALALILVAIRKIPLPSGLMRYEFIDRLHVDGGDAPYGIAIAAGALVTYPSTFWMQALAF